MTGRHDGGNDRLAYRLWHFKMSCRHRFALSLVYYAGPIGFRRFTPACATDAPSQYSPTQANPPHPLGQQAGQSKVFDLTNSLQNDAPESGVTPQANLDPPVKATDDHTDGRQSTLKTTATDASEGGEGGNSTSKSPPSPPSIASTTQTGSSALARPRGDEVYRPAPVPNPTIQALSQRGLYRRGVSETEHRFTCPFAAEHAAGEVNEARYFVPTEAAPYGTFYCPGTHAQERKIGALLDHLEVDRLQARCKQRVRVIQGEMHRVVSWAEQILADRGGFYRSNGSIVTLRHDPVSGDVTTEPVTEQALALHLSAASDWEKYDGRAMAWRRCDVPTIVVTNLCKSQSLDRLPSLNGLSRQPYLRRDDAALIKAPGYDEGTGIYAAFDPSEFHLPLFTRGNALAALSRLDALLSEFEFASETDRATVFSAMLTATIRDYLKVAPGFNITASSPGSGKSYLASLIGPFAGPGEARNISYPGTNEEATKVVLSLALEQPAAVCFDDMPTDWLPHGAMNRMLTNGSITERILGSSRVVTARAASFVMGTGNNIRPLRDMARRVVSIYLLPQVESAATRDYSGRPAELVREHRGRYVSDALTIVGAWIAAGRPKAEVANIAGFEDWSDLCRHSLIWLGQPDPATSLIDQISYDPDKEQLGELLYAWRDAFGERPTLVRQVLRKIDDDKNGDLHDAIMELPCVERGFVNQSRFGRYLSRNKNRIVGGLQLIEAPHSERRAWAVRPLSNHTAKPKPPAAVEPSPFLERVWQDEKAKNQPPVALPAI